MTISALLEIALAVSGVLILLFIAKAFQSERAWEDGAEYEMLGVPVPVSDGAPASEAAHAPHGVKAVKKGAVAGSSRTPGAIGRLGVGDRVVRFGLCVGLGYLSFTWFGMGSPAMIGGLAAVAYLFVTFCLGWDPVYRQRGWTTRLDERM